ncbi:uroporphyrinogen decarboxylase [Actinobacillus pleuropneumoniae]|nr:uroporphyrinogen decarboxylase [Actinobacillus pleuropneumoniae]
MGLGLSFGAGEGPKFARPIENKAQVDNLPIPDPESELQYVMNAVRTIRRELKGEVPLIVFQAARGHWRLIWWKAAQAKRSPKLKK